MVCLNNVNSPFSDLSSILLPQVYNYSKKGNLKSLNTFIKEGDGSEFYSLGLTSHCILKK